MFIKLILINLVIFSGFAQECNWNGIEDVTRGEIRRILIQRATEKVNSFLNEKGIVKASEEPMVAEVTTEEGGERAIARFHYKFKTQNGDEFSSDPNKKNQRQQNDFNRMEFYMWVEKDDEGQPLRQICMVYFKTINIPLFNLTLDDAFLGRLILFDFTDTFQFIIPF